MNSKPSLEPTRTQYLVCPPASPESAPSAHGSSFSGFSWTHGAPPAARTVSTNGTTGGRGPRDYGDYQLPGQEEHFLYVGIWSPEPGRQERKLFHVSVSLPRPPVPCVWRGVVPKSAGATSSPLPGYLSGWGPFKWSATGLLARGEDIVLRTLIVFSIFVKLASPKTSIS